jgi:hypothetical protein
MAEYYITGIRQTTFNQHTFISEVLIHLVENNSVHQGEIKGKDEVIRLIKARHSVFSALWNYSSIAWSRQEQVSYETVGGTEYLRTTPDNTRRDNLLHLLPIANLGL